MSRRMGAEDAVDDAAARVEEDVHRALEAAHRRDLVDVGAHRAGIGAVVRLRRGHERAVVRFDRLVGDDARKDQLAAAARAPVVRLCVADRDLQVALGDRRQQPDGRAARRDADVRVRVGVARLVLVERDAEPLEPGQVLAADLLLDVRLGHREDLAVRAREHRRLARPPRPRRARRAEASTTGVGRNWLSITIATFVADASSSEKRGPETGASSAARAASVTLSSGSGSSG